MTKDNAEARIAELEDQLALQRLMNTYHKRADAFDWAGWAQTFTEDSEFEFINGFGMMVGRQVIHDTCKGAMDHVYDVMQHVMVNLDFDVDGDSATGTGNLIFTGIMDAQKPTEYYMSGGRYNWVFRRTAEGWRIARTRLEFIWNNGGDKDAVFEDEAAETAA